MNLKPVLKTIQIPLVTHTPKTLLLGPSPGAVSTLDGAALVSSVHLACTKTEALEIALGFDNNLAD
jgi:hypothetical protein